jgi:PEP-CTERM motif
VADLFNTMKKQILTLAAAVSLSASAFAITTPTDTWNPGELMLGFSTSTGTGSSTDLMINLGSYTQFATFDGTTSLLSIVNTNDIAAVYGTDWNTRTDLNWAVAGSMSNSTTTAGIPKSTVFSVTPHGNAAISSQPITSLNADITDIAAMGTNAFNTADTTGYSNGSTVGVADSNVDSFNSRYKTSPTARFGVGNYNVTTGTEISDLYGLVPTSGLGVTNPTAANWIKGSNLLGSFTLDSTGLSFTAVNVSAVPEPSSYAAIGGLAALGFGVSRRRRQQA